MELTSPRSAEPTIDRLDDGFTLIELLIVIVILGILAAVVVFSVVGIRDRSEDSACPADERTLYSGVEAYFTLYNTSSIAAAASPEPYEQTLVDTGVLRQTSEWHDIAADGTISVVAGAPC